MTSRSRFASTYSSAGRLAAPPGGHFRQQQFLADQPFGNRRQEAEPGRGLEHAGAERVGHHDAAGAQARQAARARRARNRRAAPADRRSRRRGGAGSSARGAGRPASSGTARVAAHREVVALDQRHAELAREVGVLEVGFVERARREDHRQRRTRRPRCDCSSRRAVRRRSRARGARRCRGWPRDAPARGSRGSRARSPRPRAPACDRPAATSGHPARAPGPRRRRAARCRRRGLQIMAGPEEVRMAEGQLGRNDALRPAGAAGRRDPRAAHSAAVARCATPASMALPLRGGQHERQRIQRPGTVGALRIGVDVVGDAVLDDEPARQLERAADRVGRIVGAQPVDERPPVRRASPPCASISSS